MVLLLCFPHRGNGARSFPATGLLGISDVTLCGTLRTKLEEDKQTLEASSVVVRLRCYETVGSSGASPSSNTASGSSAASASTSRSAYNPTYASTSPAPTSSSHSNPVNATSGPMTELLKGQNNGKGRVLYEKSIKVWSAVRENAKARKAQESSSEGGNSPPRHRYPPKSRDPEYADLGDFQKSWRLVVPPEAIRQGAKSTMIFKTWRIWWALEAGTSDQLATQSRCSLSAVFHSHLAQAIWHTRRSYSQIAPSCTFELRCSRNQLNPDTSLLDAPL